MGWSAAPTSPGAAATATAPAMAPASPGAVIAATSSAVVLLVDPAEPTSLPVSTFPPTLNYEAVSPLWDSVGRDVIDDLVEGGGSAEGPGEGEGLASCSHHLGIVLAYLAQGSNANPVRLDRSSTTAAMAKLIETRLSRSLRLSSRRIMPEFYYLQVITALGLGNCTFMLECLPRFLCRSRSDLATPRCGGLSSLYIDRFS